MDAHEEPRQALSPNGVNSLTPFSNKLLSRPKPQQQRGRSRRKKAAKEAPPPAAAADADPEDEDEAFFSADEGDASPPKSSLPKPVPGGGANQKLIGELVSLTVKSRPVDVDHKY